MYEERRPVATLPVRVASGLTSAEISNAQEIDAITTIRMGEASGQAPHHSRPLLVGSIVTTRIPAGPGVAQGS
jgi:hypothetical protein